MIGAAMEAQRTDSSDPSGVVVATSVGHAPHSTGGMSRPGPPGPVAMELVEVDAAVVAGVAAPPAGATSAPRATTDAAR
jgi:hypothetical protein